MNLGSLLGAACILIWLYLLLGRGGFWRVRLRLARPSKPARVVAVVPARNEAAVVSRSLSSLLAQTALDLTVVLVDDHSTDLTAEIAYETAGAMECLERLTVIKSRPLPDGWTGKLWAVQQGIEEARKRSPDFFCLPTPISNMESIA